MTDLSQPALLFAVPLITEQVQTSMFGLVTMSEIPSRRFNSLFEDHPPDRDGRLFSWTLLCESARGENGERFTLEVLDALPNRALPDLTLLMKAALRVNAVSQAEAEKPSPLP